MKLKLQLFLIALLIISVTNAFGQISFDSAEELEKAANEAFDSKQYDKAKPLFSQLLSLNALSPDYNYRFGVCLLYTEADPRKPLPYIEGGANSTGVNPEAYYFLGKAYQLNYRFDEAISNFEKGIKAGYAAEGVDLERSIEECRNGKLLYNSAIEFNPPQDKEVIEAEFYRPYEFRKLKGKVIPMPPSFKTKFDEKNLKGTFVYTPSNSQTLFYASYGDDGANAKDLYQVNRLPNGEWAMPQRLPNTINTKYDEDFAFYDDQSQTLFFASKGHNTMGGYDVFRSVYIAENNEWSPPINLQYPINSPDDDFLYVSDPTGKVAFFTSKRETELGKIRVYKTLLYDPEQVELSVIEGTFEDKTDSIYNYMLATVFDPATNQVIGKYRSNKETGKYVLILPPQNDYSIDVGPREAAGFKFDLDVPQHEPTKPLQQNLTYDTKQGEGSLTMTNYFDAVGEPDSVAVVMNRSKDEVEAAMVEMPDPAEILAAREAERQKLQEEKEAELAKLAALEEAKLAAVKATQDSLLAVKNAAIEAEAMRLKAEAARADSIASATAAKEAMEKATKDSLLQIAEKMRLDSIAKAEQLAQENARQAAIADSIAQAEEAMLIAAAEREKFVADSISKAAEEAERLAQIQEKAIADSIARAEELAIQEIVEREAFTADSIEKANVIAQEMAMEEMRADSLNTIAELAGKDSLAEVKRLAEERALADSLKLAEELAAMEALAEKERMLADSLAKVEELAAIQALELEKAMSDSLAKADADAEAAESIKQDSILAAQVEKERLEQIEREVEEAKARALKDSVLDTDVAQADSNGKDASFQEILTEMQEKEAELLARESDSQQEVSDSTQALKEETIDTETELAQQLEGSLESKAVIAEADLFLKTIAELEQQKQLQEAEIAAENERIAQEKRAMGQSAIAKQDSLSLAEPTSELVLANDSTGKTTEPVKIEGEKDLEEESLALKSNADPNEYLKALAAMEAEMAADDAKNSKSYELQALTGNDEETDPVLQAKIEADRKVLEDHQRIAKEKEAALKEQMQRDKQVVGTVMLDEEAELAAIEEELLEAVQPENKPKSIVEKTQKEQKDKPAELTQEEQPQVSEVMVESNKDGTSEEVQEVLTEVSADVQNEDVATDSEKADMIEEETADAAQELIAEADAVAESVLTENTELTDSEETLVTEADAMIEELIEEDVAQSKPKVTDEPDSVVETDDVALVDEQQESKEAEQDQENKTEVVLIDEEPTASDLNVGRIPFLQPALRDYSNRKTDFSGIQDKTMKQMVQRMRSEDVGRLAVLKNMKNQWVDAGKTQESLQEIKSNVRNQDVLASVAGQPVREETIREPFDKNDLRQRVGVYYKLDFKLSSAQVSEFIQEAMTPEQSMTFAMPEFQITSGYFATLADVKSEKRYYQSRGFEVVRVVAFQNGEPISLSDVSDIPFVD